MLYTLSMSTTIQVPRIPKGRGFRGPEWYGCCGTGAAPCIRRSMVTGKYVVGTEMSTDQALSDYRILSNRRKFEVGTRMVFVYKTRKAAVAKFLVLCEKQEQVNAEMRQEHRRELKAAQAGDLSATMNLIDF